MGFLSKSTSFMVQVENASQENFNKQNIELSTLKFVLSSNYSISFSSFSYHNTAHSDKGNHLAFNNYKKKTHRYLQLDEVICRQTYIFIIGKGERENQTKGIINKKERSVDATRSQTKKNKEYLHFQYF